MLFNHGTPKDVFVDFVDFQVWNVWVVKFHTFGCYFIAKFIFKQKGKESYGLFYLKETPCGLPWHVVCYFHAAKHLKVLKTLKILKDGMFEKNSSDFSQSNQIVQKYKYMYWNLCNFRDMDSYLC